MEPRLGGRSSVCGGDEGPTWSVRVIVEAAEDRGTGGSGLAVEKEVADEEGKRVLVDWDLEMALADW